MTTIEAEAVGILRLTGPLTAGQLGSELWAGKDGRAMGSGNRMATKYCRPAGRLLHRMKRAGLVSGPDCLNGVMFVWTAR